MRLPALMQLLYHSGNLQMDLVAPTKVTNGDEKKMVDFFNWLCCFQKRATVSATLCEDLSVSVMCTQLFLLLKI